MLLVYMDLVILLNFLVDFLLLLGTNRLAGFSPGYRRSALAAALGGIYAGGCMVPGFHFLGNTLWRLVSLTLMAVTAFGWNRSALQRGAVFSLLSMALGGMTAYSDKKGVWMLLLCAVLIWVLCRVSFRGGLGSREYVPVEISWKNRKLRLIALKDTGNTLCDPLTGEQVLVAGADVGMELMGLSEHQLRHPVETVAAGAYPGLRLIPYHAVGQPGGMLLAVRFQNARIGNTSTNPLVAFAPEVLARGEVYRMLTGGAV